MTQKCCFTREQVTLVEQKWVGQHKQMVIAMATMKPNCYEWVLTKATSITADVKIWLNGTKFQ